VCRSDCPRLPTVIGHQWRLLKFAVNPWSAPTIVPLSADGRSRIDFFRDEIPLSTGRS
jgi:hypothetical protein